MNVTLNIANPKPADYKVKGKDITEAAAFMRSSPYAACYKANPTFDFDWDDVTCTGLVITAAPTIAMPKWPGASKLKGQEKKDWQKMMTALKKHEDSHHKKWKKAAEDFKKAREKAGDFPKKDVAKTMKAFFTKAQGVMDKYDGSTNHGESEGVTLPY